MNEIKQLVAEIRQLNDRLLKLPWREREEQGKPIYGQLRVLAEKANGLIKNQFAKQKELYRGVYDIKAVIDLIENKIARTGPRNSGYFYTSFTIDPEVAEIFGPIIIVIDHTKVKGELFPLIYLEDREFRNSPYKEHRVYTLNCVYEQEIRASQEGIKLAPDALIEILIVKRNKRQIGYADFNRWTG